MLTLAIETSCDDTAAAVLCGRCLLANGVASQLLDAKFGGVVPELASRQHMRHILPVIRRTIRQAGVELKDIHQIAATYGPGLVGSLLVGLNTAQAIAYGLNIPIIPVNHVESHMLAVFLETESVEWPAVALVVSGGHTLVSEVEGIGRYRLAGETQDDAAGECFDKIARALGLMQSSQQAMGGPLIENCAENGNPSAFAFPRPMLRSNDGHFSFSGLKTAMIQFIAAHPADFIRDRMADICASFQEAVVDVLVEKAMRACRRSGARSLILSGGVAANKRLTGQAAAAASALSIRLYAPSKKFCTDNAAMTGITAVLRGVSGNQETRRIGPRPNLRLEDASDV